MIAYKNVLAKLKEAGYTSYIIRQNNLIPQKTLTAIRNNEPINTKTINTLCKLLRCQPGEILEYTEERPEE